jgi:hypothetical protein
VDPHHRTRLRSKIRAAQARCRENRMTLVADQGHLILEQLGYTVSLSAKVAA